MKALIWWTISILLSGIATSLPLVSDAAAVSDDIPRSKPKWKNKGKTFRVLTDEEKAINDALAKYFPTSSFSVSGLTKKSEASGDNRLSGTVSFFGIAGVTLECVISPDLRPKSILATFPTSAAFRISHLDKLSGGELSSLLTQKFSSHAGISIRNFSLTLDGSNLETFEANLQSADWDFIDFDDFKMKSVEVKIQYTGKQSSWGGEIRGNVSLGNVNLQLIAALSKDKAMEFTGKVPGNQQIKIKDAIYSLAGTQEGDKFFGLIPGEAFNSIPLPALTMSCSPREKRAGFTALTDQGNVDLSVHKKGSRKEIRMVMNAKDLGALIPIDIFKQIQLTDPLLVVSNMRDRDVSFSLPGSTEPTIIDIDEGMNVVTAINLHPDIKKIFKIEKINLKGSIDSRKHVKLEGKLKIGLAIGDGGVQLNDVKFGVENNPLPKLFVDGTLSIPVSGQPTLKFTAGLSTAPVPPQLGGKLDLIVDGGGDIWKNPFGIPGIGIQGLGGDIMFTFSPPFVTELGLRGGLLLGKNLDPSGNAIRGSLNMKLNVVNPMDSYLEASVSNMTVIGMINAFSDANLSGEIANILNTGIENGKIMVNPKAGEVSASGDFKLLGLSANLAFAASKTGVAASGYMDPWNIKAGDFTIFSLTGAGGNPRPGFSLSMGADPAFSLNGKVTALESMEGSANIIIRKDGFQVDLVGKVFNGAFNGELHAWGRNLTSPQIALHADLKLSQTVVNDFKKSLNKFISDQAGNTTSQLQAVRNKVKSGSKEMDDFVKGSLDVVNGLSDVAKTAGIMIVDGLIPDVTSISFSGDLSSVSTRINMKIELRVAGKPISPIDFTMDMRNGYDQELARMTGEVGKQVLKAFEGLADQVKGWCSEVGEIFKPLGEGIIVAATAVGEFANDAVNEIDRFWNGDSFEAAASAGPLNELSPNTRHYAVTVRQIVAISALDDPIPGKIAEGTGTVVGAVVGVFDSNAGKEVQKAMTIDDPEIEVYGTIVVVSDHTMRVSPGTNANAWSRDRVRAEKNIRNGRQFGVNNTKHFYAENGTNPSITIRSKLKDYDEGEHYSSDGEFFGSIPVTGLGSWDWNNGQRYDGSFVTTCNDGGKQSQIQVDFSIELEPKVSTQQIRQAVAARDINAVKGLARKGGELREPGIIEPAIMNRDITMINFLLASGTRIQSQDIATALNLQFFDATIASKIISRGPYPSSAEDLRKGIESNNKEIVAMLIANGAVPDASHLTFALSRNLQIAQLLIASGAPGAQNELPQAINTMNLPVATLLINYGARPDINMLNQAIQANNHNMVRLILQTQMPDQASLQLASEKNNLELLSLVGSKSVPIEIETPAQRAIDFNNMELLKMCFGYGANSNSALQYAIQKENLAAITICLDNGANADPALSYAARKNNSALFNTAITQYGANPTAALSEAISANNFEMAKFAISAQASPDTRLDEVAANGNEAMVRLLVDAGGNPDLAMTGTIGKKNVNLLSYLLQKGALTDNASYMQQSVELESPDMVKLLLQSGANPDLGMAAAMGKNHYVIAGLLLEAGASPNGFLAAPAGRGDLKMVTLLLDHGASPDEGIGSAIQANQLETAKVLLEHGAATKGQLVFPSQNGNTAMVQLLLNFDADPNEGIMASVTNNKTDAAKLLLEAGASPVGLMPTAAGFGNKVIVEMLLARGIDATEGVRPAVEKNQTEVALLLLDNRAAITGLIAIAAGNGNSEIVSKLLSLGAVADEGTTPAVSNRHTAIVKQLIQAGAKVESSSFMVIAVRNKQEDMVRLLFENKCDITYKDANGSTFLHIVSDDDGQVGLASAFISFGIDIDASNNQGNTALHLAAESGKDNLAVVKILVEAGADVNAVNKKGETPRKAAKGIKVKKYLKDQGGERKIKK